MKPEAYIYEYLLNKYQLTPSNTVFLDDIKVNTDAAEKLCMATILFNNPADGKKELYEMLEM